MIRSSLPAGRLGGPLQDNCRLEPLDSRKLGSDGPSVGAKKLHDLTYQSQRNYGVMVRIHIYIYGVLQDLYHQQLLSEF